MRAVTPWPEKPACVDVRRAGPPCCPVTDMRKHLGVPAQCENPGDGGDSCRLPPGDAARLPSAWCPKAFCYRLRQY